MSLARWLDHMFKQSVKCCIEYKCDPNEWQSVSNTEGEHTCLLKDYDNFLTLSKICKMCYDNDEDLLSPSTSSICPKVNTVCFRLFPCCTLEELLSDVWYPTFCFFLFWFLPNCKTYWKRVLIMANSYSWQMILHWEAVWLEETESELTSCIFWSIMHIDRKLVAM